ncbi:Hint domain-containing protein [Bordetella muralis]|uniref:Hint domain-containing protein n=1 Tax=Bordetella muralis TaxID=1649130 RepID=UPI0039F105DE
MSQSFTFEYPGDSHGYLVDNAGVVLYKIPVTSNVTYRVTEASDDGSFAIGDTLTVETTSNGETQLFEDVTIVGTTSTGIVAQMAGAPYLSYLTTDFSQSYEVGDTIPFSTDPADVFPVCFVRGTLIETLLGPVAIEDLEPGCQVRGSTGWRTVKWIGWRNYGAFGLRTPGQKARCAPVRIRKDALGDNQPAQDLLVSPWHHLYVDGVLVRAHDLINGITITQEEQVTSVSYYHVELDQFDVVLAHGVYSESWADGGNRDFFQNVDVTALRPEDKRRRMADRPGFKALRQAQEIAAIHGRIAQRADMLASAQRLSKAA